MICNADTFTPLKAAAAEEIARQINTGEPDAERLAALGFGWSTAFQLVRQIREGGNAGLLAAHGLPNQAAKAIATAVDDAIKARPPTVASEATVASHGAKRGTSKPSYLLGNGP